MVCWITSIIIATVIVEIGSIAVVSYARKVSPENAMWVILGNKVFKLTLAAVAIIAVNYLLPEIEIVPFAIGVIIAYLVALVFETIFFLKKK